MSKLMITIFMFLAITAALMGLSNMLSKKTIIDREKSSPFECGFDSMNLSRMPFSLRFFLLGLIFLVFDVEICLILPSILTFKVSSMKLWFTTVMVMLIILIWGLFHEWFMGSLDWKN